MNNLLYANVTQPPHAPRLDHQHTIAYNQNMATSPKQLSFTDYRMRTGRGGPRRGAGRPRGPRPRVHHVRRGPVPKHAPCHVTLRVRSGIPSLRSRRFAREFRRTLRVACERGSFRVAHYSIQRDHVHLLVEAAGKRALASGMKSVSSRLAFAVQRVFGQRGRVLEGRYHVRVLRTPREVRNALAYVLLNARKHWQERRRAAPPVRLDEASSGRWFDGWKRRQKPVPRDPPEVAQPRSWLLRRGWRRHGLIDPAEIPGMGARARRKRGEPGRS